MPFLPPDLPDPGIKPVSPALVGRFFTTEPPGKPLDSDPGSNLSYAGITVIPTSHLQNRVGNEG